MADRFCIICGAPLPPRRKCYCSDQCQSKAIKARMSESYTPIRGRAGVYRDNLICRDCGRVYTGHIATIRCPSCQAEANRLSTKASAKRQRDGTSRKLGSIDTCERCGQPYTVNGSLQRYCKACAPIAIKEHRDAHGKVLRAAYFSDPVHRAERKKAIAREAVEAVCEICGAHFRGRLNSRFCSDECRNAHTLQHRLDPQVIAAQRAAFLRRMEDPAYAAEVRRKDRECHAKRMEDPEVRAQIYKAQYQAKKKRLENDPEKQAADRKAHAEAAARRRARLIAEDPEWYRAERARKAREYRAARKRSNPSSDD